MVILHKLYGLFCAYIVKIFWREVETYEKEVKTNNMHSDVAGYVYTQYRL